MYSSGVTTSTFIIGSSNTGLAFEIPSLNAALAAISNARTLESTSWYAPSYKVALKSIHGKPAITPVCCCAIKPFSTPGICSVGIFPPFI